MIGELFADPVLFDAARRDNYYLAMDRSEVAQLTCRDLSVAARSFKAIDHVGGVFYFIAGYAGLLVAWMAWILPVALISFCVIMSGRAHDERDAPVTLTFPLLAPLAFFFIAWLFAEGLASVADRWRDLRLRTLLNVALVTVVVLGAGSLSLFIAFHSRRGESVAPLIFGATALIFGFLFARGVISAVRLRRCVFAAPSGKPPIFDRVPTLLASESRRRAMIEEDEHLSYRWRIRFEFLKTGGIVVLLSFAIRIVTQVMVSAANDDMGVAAGAANLVAFVLTLLILFMLSRGLSRRLRDAREDIAPRLDSARRADPRPPILLLRSFRDESRLAHESEIRFLSSSRSHMRSVEEQVTDRLWRFGPVIAIGRPGDPKSPLGAAREYLRSKDDNEWKRFIRQLVPQCAAVLMVAGSTDGLAWEADHILNGGSGDRLLIVIPPWMSNDEWWMFLRRTGLSHAVPSDKSIDSDDGKRVLGMRLSQQTLVIYHGHPDQFGYESLSMFGVAELINYAA